MVLMRCPSHDRTGCGAPAIAVVSCARMAGAIASNATHAVMERSRDRRRSCGRAFVLRVESIECRGARRMPVGQNCVVSPECTRNRPLLAGSTHALWIGSLAGGQVGSLFCEPGTSIVQLGEKRSLISNLEEAATRQTHDGIRARFIRR